MASANRADHSVCPRPLYSYACFSPLALHTYCRVEEQRHTSDIISIQHPSRQGSLFRQPSGPCKQSVEGDDLGIIFGLCGQSWSTTIPRHERQCHVHGIYLPKRLMPLGRFNIDVCVRIPSLVTETRLTSLTAYIFVCPGL